MRSGRQRQTNYKVDGDGLECGAAGDRRQRVWLAKGGRTYKMSVGGSALSRKCVNTGKEEDSVIISSNQPDKIN